MKDTEKKGFKLGTMDVILLIVGICLIVFTAKMISVYENTGSIPETLCTCVFATLGGECGVMGWIKTVKEKTKESGDQEETSIDEVDECEEE